MHPAFGGALGFYEADLPLVALLTNGTSRPRAVAVMLRHQRKIVITSSAWIVHTADVHDKRRGVVGTAFEPDDDPRRMLADLGFLVRVSMVVDEGTWQDVEGTLLLARSLGASCFAYAPDAAPRARPPCFASGPSTAPRSSWKKKGCGAKYAGFLRLLSEESVFDLEVEWWSRLPAHMRWIRKDTLALFHALNTDSAV